MRLGIYARGLSGKGGVHEAIHTITEVIIKFIKPTDELFIVHNVGNIYFEGTPDNVHEIFMTSNNKFVCDYIQAPRILNNLNLDAIWFPKNVIPFFIKARKVVTVHDLAYYLPEYNAYEFVDTLYMKTMIRSSCKRADKITTISQLSKNDIVEILDIPSEKVEITFWGAADIYKAMTNLANIDANKLQQVKERYQLPEKFILYTGDITPRKNLARLIKAFNQIEDENLYLVMTGIKNYKTPEANALINKSNRVKQIGYIDRDEMPYLYRLAYLYAYPSLYEGMGRPVLEAHACGCPVVASGTSAIPEIGGNAVCYIKDPLNVENIKQQLLKVLNDENYRQDLIAKGYENEKQFSCDISGMQILNLLKGKL